MYTCVELEWSRGGGVVVVVVVVGGGGGREFHCSLMKWSIPINENFGFTDNVKNLETNGIKWKALIYMLFIVPMKYIDK